MCFRGSFSFFIKVGSWGDGRQSVQKRLETSELVQTALTHTWWPLVFCDIGELQGFSKAAMGTPSVLLTAWPLEDTVWTLAVCSAKEWV